jgi:glycogen debranching enzyme
VWAWLIGPFVEAYLRVEDGRGHATAQARGWLAAFDGHLRDAGLGSVSEVFDGDLPHEPRGCIAQAWSVGELLRAKQLLRRCEREGRFPADE